MNVTASVFDSRMSFELAALLVSLAAFALLAVIAVNLHLRLARVETRLEETAGRQGAYERIRGRILELDPAGARFVLLLSSNCESCARILTHLRSHGGGEPMIVTWIDQPSPPSMTLPGHLRMTADGPAIAKQIGTGVTPFLLEIEESGRILDAGPVLSLESLPPRRTPARGLHEIRAASAGQEA